MAATEPRDVHQVSSGKWCSGGWGLRGWRVGWISYAIVIFLQDHPTTHLVDHPPPP